MASAASDEADWVVLGMLAGDMIEFGAKSEGSISEGSLSLSDTSSIRAFRDIVWGGLSAVERRASLCAHE